MAGLDKSRFEAAFARSREAAGIVESGEHDPLVQDLWGFLEPRLEDRGALEHEARDHLKENTQDIRSWRRARTFATGFAVFVVLVTMITLGTMLSGRDGLTHLANVGSDNVRVAFLAGSFATIFGLTALLVRGAFTPRRDEGTGWVPENAKVVMETFGSLLKDRG